VNVVDSAAVFRRLTWFIKDLNIIVVIFLSAIFYLAVLRCLKGMTRSDLGLIRQMIHR
jgi:hypothetical protein